jgi:hypothetical protein
LVQRNPAQMVWAVVVVVVVLVRQSQPTVNPVATAS